MELIGLALVAAAFAVWIFKPEWRRSTRAKRDKAAEAARAAVERRLAADREALPAVPVMAGGYAYDRGGQSSTDRDGPDRSGAARDDDSGNSGGDTDTGGSDGGGGGGE